MKIEITEHKGTLEPGRVKDWRANPGNFEAAARAAVHYAKRDKALMVVIPGNSYGRAVFHIAPGTAELRTFTATNCRAAVATAHETGVICYAVASD